MSDEVTVQHLIAHSVDHHNLTAPRLSEREPPFDQQVASFFARHIRDARNNPRCQESVFQADGAKVGSLCGDILKDPKGKFVSASQEIARLLFSSMLRTLPHTESAEEPTPKPDKRISRGELVVAVLSEGKKVEPWLALLKMDPAEGFASEPKVIDGQFCFVFKQVGDVMPTGELQKCAFVKARSLGKRRRVDLVVLDQQVSRLGGYRMASSFFTERFLHCDPVLRDSERNLAFIVGSQSFADQQDWSQDQRAEFQEGLRLTVQQPRIDVAHFSQIYIPAERQDDFLDFMKNKQGLSQFVFSRDPEAVASLTRFKEFTGDAGLRLIVEGDRVGPGKMVTEVWNEATGEWEVTIRTIHWESRFVRGAT